MASSERPAAKEYSKICVTCGYLVWIVDFGRLRGLREDVVVARLVGLVEVVWHHSCRIIVEVNALVQKLYKVDRQKGQNGREELELLRTHLEEANTLFPLQNYPILRDLRFYLPHLFCKPIVNCNIY